MGKGNTCKATRDQRARGRESQRERMDKGKEHPELKVRQRSKLYTRSRISIAPRLRAARPIAEREAAQDQRGATRRAQDAFARALRALRHAHGALTRARRTQSAAVKRASRRHLFGLANPRTSSELFMRLTPRHALRCGPRCPAQARPASPRCTSACSSDCACVPLSRRARARARAPTFPHRAHTQIEPLLHRHRRCAAAAARTRHARRAHRRHCIESGDADAEVFGRPAETPFPHCLRLKICYKTARSANTTIFHPVS